MKAHGWFKEELERAKDTFEYKLEGLELEVTEKILEIMERKRIRRTELAQSLGVSKAAISKLLNNGSNMTIKRLLAIAEALNCELKVNLEPTIQESKEQVVQYTPKAKAKSPRFDLEGWIIADDYRFAEEINNHALNAC